MWSDFLTIQENQPPLLSKELHVLLLCLIFFLFVLTLWNYQDRRYRNFFLALQWVQVLSLYSWYALFAFSWQLSLPLYHCRIAMLGILFIPHSHPWKVYLAMMGLLGSMVSLIYPVLDNYAFPHITHFSFFLGHIALMVNCLVYLLLNFQKEGYQLRHQVYFLALINLLILTVSFLTGGDYGFMRHLPILESDHVWLNYGIMTFVFGLALGLLSKGLAFLQSISLKQIEV